MKTLFRFRQDMRVEDNTWLCAALQDSDQIVAIFVFDMDILSQFPKPDARLGFVIDAVKNLESQLRHIGISLIVQVGKSQEIITQLTHEHDITALYHNRSYGIGSQSRDQSIQQWCNANHIKYQNYSDYLLVEPQDVDQRKVFTPFYNLWKKVDKAPVQKLSSLPTQTANQHIESIDRPAIQSQLSYLPNTQRPINGHAQRLLQDMSHYDISRNELRHDGTTKLSPYVRFGLISIR